MNIVKAAIIGCGKIGSDYDSGLEDKYIYSHAKAYKLNSKVNLIAACDINKDQLSLFKNKWGEDIKLYSEAKELLSTHPDLDLVSVCSPTDAHEFNLLQLLETDVRYVLCEKPFLENLSNARIILDKYKAKNKTLMVNHVLRWEPGVHAIQKRIQNKKRNNIQAVNVLYAKGFWHNGVHVVDLSLSLFGEPERIIKLTQFEEIQEDSTCSFVFLYPDFHINFSGVREAYYSIFEYSIYLESGKISITDLTNKIVFNEAVDHPFLKGYRYLSPDDVQNISSFQYKNMALVIKDIVDGILSNDTRLFRCTADNAYNTMIYMEKIREMKCLYN